LISIQIFSTIFSRLKKSTTQVKIRVNLGRDRKKKIRAISPERERNISGCSKGYFSTEFSFVFIYFFVLFFTASESLEKANQAAANHVGVGRRGFDECGDWLVIFSFFLIRCFSVTLITNLLR
jgi:hypothetical protein